MKHSQKIEKHAAFLKTLTKSKQRDRLTPEQRAAYKLISKNAEYATAAKVLEAGVIELHKACMAMLKKNMEAVLIAWHADR